MKRLGLIGYPLDHSFSGQYFADKFKNENIKGWSYDLFPLENITEFETLVASMSEKLVGLNVTIPHKQNVIPFLDELSPASAEIGAVNTILFQDNKRIGYNTDWIGFVKSISPLLKEHHANALVLGSGGASKAVIYALATLNVSTRVVSRFPKNGQLGYDQLTKEIIQQHQIIVNATPTGTFPTVDAFPEIPYAYISDDHLLYDLVYNPPVSVFLKKGQKAGAEIINGQQMLMEQAEAAWLIWTGSTP